MKIAQVAPLFESVPPKLYGGTERIVSYLTEELVRQGHEVTLFASGDSRTRAELVAGSEMALRLSKRQQDPVLEHLLMLEKLRERASQFDVIHFHIDLLQFPVLRVLGCPAITTLHGRLDMPGLVRFYRAFRDVHLVTISRAQRRSLHNETQASLVYHGLPPDLLPRSSGRGAYLAFLGRISPEKGPVEAIEIARAAGMPLKIAAKVDAADQDYWRDVVKPLIDRGSGVEYVGEITQQEKVEFLGGASALLFPIDWPEPFGLVMIEAMACGTPVVAYPMGSVPEVVEEGQSGHIVGSREAAIAVLQKIDRVDRKAVRQCFDRRFSVERMTANYLRLYERLIESDRPNGYRHGRQLALLDRDAGMRAIRMM